MSNTSHGGAKSSPFSPLSKISTTVHQHEAVRSAVRAGLATALAYFVGVVLQVSDVTWAVISALYVLQTSVGGTLNMALGRMMGAALGIVLGLGAVFMMGSEWWMNLIALLAVVGVIGAVGEIKPELRYGGVVAAILIISPGEAGLLTEAIEKAYAIALGSIVGAIVGVFVFPVTAHQSARRHLATAVRQCAQLVELAFDADAKCGTQEWTKLHKSVERELAIAGDRLGQSRLRNSDSNSKTSSTLQAADRLWHHVSMFDRMVSGGDREPSEEQENLLAEARKVSCSYLERVADAVAKNACPPDLGEGHEELDRVSQKWAGFEERVTRERKPGEDKHVAILAFGWRQLHREMEHLTSTLGEDEGSEPQESSS
ncbi:FUSC family protein [Devosia sp. RR2S18]|uniref:FUSC family protein n=1 Tax=Devosia rhizosphaerae TaxID=3049774 RepID=UPI0025407873|nr:FUSC family protein [Devosia sp. RR2S18]WIJ24978.1 FUSC family protein [Devosia sp. RR2S18]